MMMATEEAMNDRPRHWHLDKRLNVSHLLTTVALATGMIGWGAAMDRRVAILEERAAAQRNIDDRQDAELLRAHLMLKEEIRGVRDELRDQSKKLDRLIERLPNHTTRSSVP
jgi:hypothetical protein